MNHNALRLFVVRHGETAENVKMAYLGLRDEPLNENGRRQAECVARAFDGLPLRLIVTSPMCRATATAEGIRQATGAELRVDERLREGSFGRWEGRTRNEVLSGDPTDAALLLRWEEDPAIAPPGGESSVEVQRRVVSLVEELAAAFPGESVALVSHVGPIKALMAAALGISPGAARRLFLDPATISVVEWSDHSIVRLFNSHAHLGWTAARWMK